VSIGRVGQAGRVLVKKVSWKGQWQSNRDRGEALYGFTPVQSALSDRVYRLQLATLNNPASDFFGFIAPYCDPSIKRLIYNMRDTC